MTSITLSMIFIIVFFYTYSGILGFNLIFLDIGDFVIADALCCFISYKMLTGPCRGDKADSLKGVATLRVIGLCFVLLTNNPPDLGLFWG